MFSKFYPSVGSASTDVALLIHGVTSSSSTWKSTVGYLTAGGYNVVTVELEGHGDNVHLDSYSFEGWIGSIMNVLDSYNVDSVDLIIGHSLGGLLAAGVAVRVPTGGVFFIDPLLTVPSFPVRVILKKRLKFKILDSFEVFVSKFPHREFKLLQKEYAALQKWDVKTLNALNRKEGRKIIEKFFNSPAAGNSFLVRPVDSVLVPESKVNFFVKHGVEVLTVDNVGHGLHLDDPEGFKVLLSETILQ